MEGVIARSINTVGLGTRWMLARLLPSYGRIEVEDDQATPANAVCDNVQSLSVHEAIAVVKLAIGGTVPGFESLLSASPALALHLCCVKHSDLREALSAFAIVIQHFSRPDVALENVANLWEQIYGWTSDASMLFAYQRPLRFEIDFAHLGAGKLLMSEVLRFMRIRPVRGSVDKVKSRNKQMNRSISIRLRFQSEKLNARELSLIEDFLDQVFMDFERLFSVDALEFKPHKFRDAEFQVLVDILENNNVY